MTTQPRRRFRELLAQPGIIVSPVVYDPLTARIAERIGIEVVALGGYAMGAHRATSEPLMSLEDVAAITRSVAMATSLALRVDAGAGFGDPLHVMHTVKVLEHAGAGSIQIEDQVFPKRAHYHKGVEHVIPVATMVAKIQAALKARTDPDLIITARTDAMRTDGYDEGIRRAQAYADAGAEMILLFPNNEAEARRVPMDIRGVPLIYVNSPGNRDGRGLFTAEQLESWGWKVASDSTTTIIASVRAVRDALTEVKATGRTHLSQEELIPIRKYIEDTIGLDEYYAIEEATVEHA